MRKILYVLLILIALIPLVAYVIDPIIARVTGKAGDDAAH